MDAVFTDDKCSSSLNGLVLRQLSSKVITGATSYAERGVQCKVSENNPECTSDVNKRHVYWNLACNSRIDSETFPVRWPERSFHSKTFWTLTFGLLARNIAPLLFNTERVAETTLRKSWFWPSLAGFPGSWGIFSSPGDSQLAPDGFGLQWNKHRETFWTLTFKLLGRNKASLHFKTETVSETA